MWWAKKWSCVRNFRKVTDRGGDDLCHAFAASGAGEIPEGFTEVLDWKQQRYHETKAGMYKRLLVSLLSPYLVATSWAEAACTLVLTINICA